MIDEAYHEFAQQSVVSLLNEHDNLMVLRTFSKAMAFAALRVGYLLASPDLVRKFARRFALQLECVFSNRRGGRG